MSALTEFGRFTQLERLGQGGMGAVYKATDAQNQRTVALKLLIPPGEADPTGTRVEAAREGVKRLLREARLAAALDHPGVVRVLEVGDDAEVPYIAMEYVEGSDLEALLHRAAPPSMRRRVEIVRDVARALAHAHSRGILHRDLKPSNVLVASDGRACITDFGLGRAYGHGPSSIGTLPGTQLGTPLYMSPEQVRGEVATLGPSTDLWSLGVVLYQALTGALPFQGSTLAEVLVAISTSTPVSPRAIDRFVPPEAERVCLQCLEKDPSRRPSGAAAVADELTALLEGGTAVRSPSAAPTVAAQSLGRFRTVLLRPAALFRETIRRSSWFLFLGTVVSTVLSVLASRLLFPEAGGLLAVCLLTLSLQEELVGILEENRDRIWASRESPARSNARLALKLVTLFFGMLFGFAATTFLMSEGSARAAFGPLLGRSGVAATRIEEIDFGSPSALLGHNAVVAMGCFLFSLLFRSGGTLLFLAWNASAWGSVYGFVVRLRPSGQVEYAARVLLATSPHILIEAGGYALTGIAGIFVSKAIAKYGFEHEAFRRVAVASLLLLLVGLALVGAGAVVECVATPALVRALIGSK